MTRKNKKADEITWHGGRFVCWHQEKDGQAPHLFLWVRGGRELAYRVLPAEAPNSALLDLYREISPEEERPDFLYLSEESLLDAMQPAIEEGASARVALRELLQKAADHRRRQLEEDAENPKSYLEGGCSTELISAVFTSAAKLYRAEPWKNFECGGFPFQVQSSVPGLENATLELESFVGLGGAIIVQVQLDTSGLGEVLLSFSEKELLREELLAEISAHQWEVAGEGAFPYLYAGDGAALATLSPERASALLGACEAMTHFITLHKHQPSLPGLSPVTETIAVSSLPGNPEIAITGPHPELGYKPEAYSERLEYEQNFFGSDEDDDEDDEEDWDEEEDWDGEDEEWVDEDDEEEERETQELPRFSIGPGNQVVPEPAAPRQYAKTRWMPAPGEAPPVPNALCPCGSGKKYKKCCMVR